MRYSDPPAEATPKERAVPHERERAEADVEVLSSDETQCVLPQLEAVGVDPPQLRFKIDERRSALEQLALSEAEFMLDSIETIASLVDVPERAA